MLRWTNGITGYDNIRNEDICDQIVVASILEKLREVCLRWYGHVTHAEVKRSGKVLGKSRLKKRLQHYHNRAS